MKTYLAVVLLLVSAIGAWNGYGGPQQQDESSRPIDSVRASLRAVASMQNVYYQEHGRFSSDLEVLKKIPGCVIQKGVTVRIIHGSEDGFAMEGTHPDYEGRSCVQWYGVPGVVPVVATAREGKRGDESPGRVICDEA